jgi:hypothetical protein
MTKELLSALNKVVNVTEKNAEKLFSEIADEIFSKYVLRKNSEEYRFTIIEFYWHSKEHPDTTVYPRSCPTGSFFFHQSGFDIAFESDYSKGNYGGILIRGIEPVNSDAANATGSIDLKDRPCNILEHIFEFNKKKQTYEPVAVQIVYKIVDSPVRCGSKHTKEGKLYTKRRVNISEGDFKDREYCFKSNVELQSTKNVITDILQKK